MLFSRQVEIDKIAEIIGGKDEKAAQIMEAYLERQEYRPDIEFSLRSFMQTFRMAGIDSQVVFRILEQFAFKWFERDISNLFVDSTEAYEFTYLLIVLQTCQHNASIKEKTSLERFFTQAEQIVPKSYANLPEGFVKNVFEKITLNEIKAPVSRSLLTGSFTLGHLEGDV